MSSNDRELASSTQSSKTAGSAHVLATYVILGSLVLLLIATLVLAAIAVHFGVTNRNKIDELSKSNLSFQATTSSYCNSLAQAVNTGEVFDHLREFQRLANLGDGTRTIGTLGFNLTVDYIDNLLSRYSELSVKREEFTSTKFWTVSEIPTLIFYVNSIARSSVMHNNFYPMLYAKGANFNEPVRMTVVENEACNESNWLNATPYPADHQSVVLVKRNRVCNQQNVNIAIKYNVSGLVIYNDGLSTDGQAALLEETTENVTFPAFFLTHALGTELAQFAANSSTNTSVTMILQPFYVPDTVVENICAWTKAGDPNQTIVIGSHSDSVAAGPGINDNGSGSAANLVLATTLAHLYQSSYKKYPYRIKFCWWAAEELGLLGSLHHVSMLRTSSTIGERIQDYLVYLNYDMLGSSNYMFGIYDGNTTDRDITPSKAIPGSIRITEIYRDWFVHHFLPWTSENLAEARSDNYAFSTQGIVVVGLFSGAEVIKSTAERNKYESKLGMGKGGIAEVAYDTCYHKFCDTIENINPFAMEQMTKAAAHAIDYLGGHPDLKQWLYPDSQIRELEQRMKNNRHHLQKPDFSRSFAKTYGMKNSGI